MNPTNSNEASPGNRRFSLEVFRDKMLQNLHPMKGGESDTCLATSFVAVQTDDSEKPLEHCND